MKQRTINQYLKDKYGQKIYKIAIDGGFTCPNRDGKLDTRGCIFCSSGGSGDFAGNKNLSITEQIEQGKKRVESKMPSGRQGGNNRYIAYFQAFTNTYASAAHLRSLYMEAVENPHIVSLSIGTRPDCLSDEILNLLEEINRIKPVWIELGLQTIHEKTAEYIRRGYPLQVYDEAVRELKKRNIDVITHIILGLPGETRTDMLESVRYVGESGVQGIKLQLLHVLKGTDLEIDYRNGLFKCMTMEEYIDLISDCLDILPDNIIIHRLTGDGPKKILIAPEWSADKKRVLNELQKKII